MRTITLTNPAGERLFPDVEVSEAVKRRDINYTGKCDTCQVHGVWHRVEGVTRCGSCQAVIHIEAWARDPAPDGRLPGFGVPPEDSNGHVPGAFS